MYFQYYKYVLPIIYTYAAAFIRALLILYLLTATGDNISVSVMTSSNQTTTQNTSITNNSVHAHPTPIQSSVHVSILSLNIYLEGKL